MRGYRDEIDGLRALAILPVLLFHANGCLPGGFSGVDVFFVISGYLITRQLSTQLHARTFSMLGFYERRARRILPALWAMMLFVALLGPALMLPNQLLDLGWSQLATTTFVANILFAHRLGYFSPNGEFDALQHMWSLAVEEQYYVLFPWALLLTYAMGRRAPLWVFGALLAPAFGFGWWLSQTHPTQAFYASTARAWELMLGSWLALQGGATRDTAKNLCEGASWLGLALLLGGMALITPQDLWPGYMALCPTVGAALILWSCSAQDTRVSKTLSHPALRWVGLRSYALYLWHWPIFVALRLRSASPHLGLVDTTLGLGAALACAELSWRFIERPTRDRERVTSRHILWISLLGGGVFGLCALTFITQNGFPERLSETGEVLMSAHHDADPFFTSCTPETAADPGDEVCRFGAARDPSYVLWGDSHAPAIRSAFEHALPHRSGAIWWANSCPALLDVHIIGHPQREHCQRTRQRLVTWLQAHPEIDTVVLAGRWLPVFGGLSEVGGSAHIFLEDSSSDKVSVEENLAVFARGLARTTAWLRSQGRRVVILGGVPEAGVDVPTTLSLAQHNGAQITPHIERWRVDRDHAPVDRILERVAAQDTHVSFVPLLPGLCTRTCPFAVDGLPIFFDSNHLSFRVSTWVLGPFLSRALPTHLRAQSSPPNSEPMPESSAPAAEPGWSPIAIPPTLPSTLPSPTP